MEDVARLVALMKELLAKLPDSALSGQEIDKFAMTELLHRAEEIISPGDADKTRTIATDRDPADSSRDQPLPLFSEMSKTGQWTQMESGSEILGKYRLLQKLGEGGMGQVWMAQQSVPVKRKVAIKLIKAGMDSNAVLTRFDQERQALALMDHPNIAKVYDAGVSGGGLPFFVMEFVNGATLVNYCDQKRLSLRARLELFLPICRAVQHAHQKGIIHRDLKPANILVVEVDGKPIPKVIDFGVAKAMSGKLVESTLSTQLGTIIGTLEYMAPEQAGLSNDDIDTRADVYSLGVILYELLAGLRPFDGQRLKRAVFTELHRIIQEEVPSKPSTRLSTADGVEAIASARKSEPKKLAAMLRGELDWIIMKCLEKSRDRRYETASSLASDLQRYLADEPVEARPPSASYLAMKFLHRNKSAVLAASAIAVCMLLGTAGSVWGWREARQQRDVADQALQQETVQRQEAERQRAAAEAAIQAERVAREQERRRTAQVMKSNDILASIFKALNPHEEQDDGKLLQARLGEQLISVVKNLQQDDIGDEIRLAELQVVLGEALYYLGYPKESVPLFQSAVDAYRRSSLLATKDGVNAMSDLIATRRKVGQVKEALALAEEARTLVEKALPESDQLADILNQFGNSLQMEENYTKAIQFHSESLRIARKLHGMDHPTALNAEHNLAFDYSQTGQSELASKIFEELSKRTGKDNSIDILARQDGLAAFLVDMEQTQKGLEIQRDVYEGRKTKLGADHPETLSALYNLVHAYRQNDDTSKAQTLVLDLIERSTRRLGADDRQTLRARFLLGMLYDDNDQMPEAVATFQAVFDDCIKIFGDRDYLSISILSNLAASLSEFNQHAKGLELQQRAIQLAELSFGEDSSKANYCRRILVTQYRRNGQYLEAIEEGTKLSATVERQSGPTSPVTLDHLFGLGLTYSQNKQYDKAVEVQRDVVQRWVRGFGQDHFQTIDAEAQLAKYLAKAGLKSDAQTLLESVYERSQRTSGEYSRPAAACATKLARFYYDQERFAECEVLERKALEIYQRQLGMKDSQTLIAMDSLATTLDKRQMLDEALVLHRECLQANEELYGLANDQTHAALHSLANCLELAKKYDEAIDQYKRLVELRTIHLGSDHIKTAVSKYNLAYACTLVERYAEAEALLRQVLDVREKTLGTNDSETVKCCQRLAICLEDSGQLEAALPFYERSLKARLETLGTSDADTFQARKNLANCLRRLKKHSLARTILEEDIQVCIETFGVDDSRTVDARAQLGYLLYQADQYKEALPILLDTLAWREEFQGLRDEATLVNLNHVGLCHDFLGDSSQAELHFKRALAGWMDFADEKHPKVLELMENLARTTMALNKVSEGIELHEKIYSIRSDAGARTSFEVVESLYNLANAYRAGGQAERAIPLLQKLFEMRDQIANRELATSGVALYSLMLLEREQWSQAEPVLRQCLALREELIPDSWLVANTKSMLGGSLLGQDRLAEAEPLLLKAHDDLSSHLEKTKNQFVRRAIIDRLRETIMRLKRLYEQKGQADESQKWNSRLEELAQQKVE